MNVSDEIKNESLARATLQQNTMNELSGERDARIREMAALQNSVTEQRETVTSLATNSAQIRRDVENFTSIVSDFTLRLTSKLHVSRFFRG